MEKTQLDAEPPGCKCNWRQMDFSFLYVEVKKLLPQLQ